MDANKEYKDTLFRFLFNQPDLLRELYCAVEGVTLPHDIPVVINTLEETLFNRMKNDLSFEIGGKLVVLIEHQSTINYNMAFRMLLYVTRIYEKIIKNEDLYKKKRIPLPRPEFFVLYNGSDPHPDEIILKLSDAFADTVALGLPENHISLELTVRVLNINYGKNVETVQRCEALAHYSAFIAKVQEYLACGYPLKKAIRMAIQYCIEHDILKEFLEKNTEEVVNMLTFEWDPVIAEKVTREEEAEEKAQEIARNALAEGASVEFIQRITGLEIDVIEHIQSQL